MAKLTVGGVMPAFEYDTPYASKVKISETVKKVSGKTAIVFLRYYGCTLCQYDIQQFSQEYDKITAGGGQLLVVLQSDPAKLASTLSEGDLPFDIICDPDQQLYKDFEIKPAESMEAMLDEATMVKIQKVQKTGLTHGDYEGNEQQLPAAFVVDQDLKISYAHYGKAAGDVPEPDELANLLA